MDTERDLDFCPQDSILELLSHVTNNDMKGADIVCDLKANRDLWSSVWFSNASNAFILRDLVSNSSKWDLYGCLHVDTLHIMFPKRNINKVNNICKKWKPDTIGLTCEQHAKDIIGDDFEILSMWWD